MIKKSKMQFDLSFAKINEKINSIPFNELVTFDMKVLTWGKLYF